MPKKKGKKKKAKLSPAEKKALQAKRLHRKDIRSTFTLIGFKRVPGTSDKEFTFEGTTSDFDDVFVYENILVFLEYRDSASAAEPFSHRTSVSTQYEQTGQDQVRS